MVAASKERVVEVERFGALRLPLGGKSGYIGVRGKQGPNKDKYQGYTQDKQHTTKLFDEPQEAAVALAQLEQDIAFFLLARGKYAYLGWGEWGMTGPFNPEPAHGELPPMHSL